MNTKGSKKARKDFFTGMGFILPSLLGFLIFTFRSVYKELHADHETGAADNK